jgi:putative spermidine/putrescine transport system ATP-binding protein
MSTLELVGIGKRFGATTAVEGVGLMLPEARLIAFLGPSGCGKTTLLRMIAGLEAPTAGRIRLDGEDITDLPAHRRRFGMVFQSLALFPHLDVARNIAYALRIRGVPESRWRARVGELLDLVRLPGVERRHVAQLSGGERQRVAIARALALEPRLFLLDEPLSALDAKLREAMQVELRLLQQRLAITTVMVTHDQREAMTMADLVVVMDRGRIQQTGPPLAIYRRPANSFVAGFIGQSNLIPGEATDGGVRLAGTLLPGAGDGLPPGPVVVSIRPEDVVLLAGAQPGPGRLLGRVAFVRDLGATTETHIEAGGVTLVATTTPRDRPEVATGDEVTALLPADECVVLEA